MLDNFIMINPTLTAGLNEAPDMLPTAYAPETTVRPIATPKYVFPLVLLENPTFKMTKTSAKVNKNSAIKTGNISTDGVSIII